MLNECCCSRTANCSKTHIHLFPQMLDVLDNMPPTPSELVAAGAQRLMDATAPHGGAVQALLNAFSKRITEVSEKGK